MNAEVDGKPYRFILDTGSPTILTKKIADDLGLEIRGENTGKDANGRHGNMNLSVLNQLTIGDVKFRNISVFIFDPSHLGIGNCFIDGGIIGSEIMPLSNWQINFAKEELILANDSHQLEYIAGAKKSELKFFNYPFYPILEYKINDKFTDNAIFDTGSTELLHLNKLAFEELRASQIVNSETGKAFGASGESVGGRGKGATFHLVPLRRLSIGEVSFHNIEVWDRTEVPSLVGAKIFKSYIVTLDYVNKIVYFYKYHKPMVEKESFGFKPYPKNQSVYIGFIKEPSPAAEAGLKLHDQIVKVNDIDLKQINISEQCDILKRLSTALQMTEIEITFISDGSINQVLLKKNDKIK